MKPKGIVRRGIRVKKTWARGLKVRLKPSLTRNLPRTAKKRKKVEKGTPAWIKAIPRGKHGSGHLEQRLWTLTSAFVRIRDFYEFDGECVATGKRLSHWNEGQARHYRSYPECNGMYKFNPQNIHLQTAKSNSWPTTKERDYFRNTLQARYGIGAIERIDEANAATENKRNIYLVMDEIECKIELIKKLPEQYERPPYWNRLMELRAAKLLELQSNK